MSVRDFCTGLTKSALFIVLSSHVACKEKVEEPNPADKVIKIRELNQLGTVEYKVTKIIAGADDQNWFKVGNRKILFSCEAVVKAGIDFSRLKPGDIKIENKNVSLRLPKAEIIYIKIDHNQIKEEYNEVGAFRNEFTNKEKEKMLVLGEQSLKKAIPDMGILVYAENNAKLFLASYLRSCGFSDCNIEYY